MVNKLQDGSGKNNNNNNDNNLVGETVTVLHLTNCIIKKHNSNVTNNLHTFSCFSPDTASSKCSKHGRSLTALSTLRLLRCVNVVNIIIIIIIQIIIIQANSWFRCKPSSNYSLPFPFQPSIVLICHYFDYALFIMQSPTLFSNIYN